MFSLPHVSLAKSEDAIKDPFGFAGKLHCAYKMYISPVRLLIRIAFMCNFVGFILGDSFLFSRVVCQPSIRLQRSLQMAGFLSMQRTYAIVRRCHRVQEIPPSDICLISTNFLTRELTFLAQSFVFRDRQKETASISQGANVMSPSKNLAREMNCFQQFLGYNGNLTP